MRTKVTWRERLAIHALSLFAKIKKLADVNHDGTLDSDDLLAIYTAVKSWLVKEGPVIAGWATMTPGARIDAAIAALKPLFPHAKDSLWILMESLAFAALTIGLI